MSQCETFLISASVIEIDLGCVEMSCTRRPTPWKQAESELEENTHYGSCTIQHYYSPLAALLL